MSSFWKIAKNGVLLRKPKSARDGTIFFLANRQQLFTTMNILHRASVPAAVDRNKMRVKKQPPEKSTTSPRKQTACPKPTSSSTNTTAARTSVVGRVQERLLRTSSTVLSDSKQKLQQNGQIYYDHHDFHLKNSLRSPAPTRQLSTSFLVLPGLGRTSASPEKPTPLLAFRPTSPSPP